MARILLATQKVVDRFLRQIKQDHDAVHIKNPVEFGARVSSEEWDVVIAEASMAEGLEEKSLEHIEQQNTVLIFLTSGEGLSPKLRERAFAVVEEPWTSDKLQTALKNALKHRKLLQTIEQLRQEEEKKYFLVGKSEAMRRLWDDIRKVAASDATVLIVGESGTGKELVARAIHKLSRRKNEPFVRVNCAAIPEELIESELFGHERGAFTGAYERKIGKFEMAHRGTLFLDEIGDMSLRTQAKLLRAIESGEIQRIGSNKIINVDVRIIAATNKDLEQLIKEGNFREDLYYRLSVVVIKTPPLRKRKEDIPLLVQHFVELFSEENNYPKKRFTERAMAALMNYHWPGNVRELKNIVERLLTMVDSDVIDIVDIPDYIIASVDEEKSAVFRARTLQEFKERAERMFIIQKLKENNWNIKKTAEAIGTPRSNLYRKLIQYGIIRKMPEEES